MNRENERYDRVTALDQGFKTVVHDSDVLSWLIRSNVDEFMDKSIDEIKACLNIGEDGRTVIGRETEYGSHKNGMIVTDSIFDVRIPGTDDEISVIVNLDGQYDPNPGYPLEKRAEYYLARLVSSQKGIDFTGDDYGKIRKVYSIWIILDPRSEYRNTVVRYKMEGRNIAGDPNRRITPMDTFNIVFINTGRYDSTLPDVTAFPAALFSKMGMEERQELMMNKFNIALNDVINREVENMTTLDEDRINYGFRMGQTAEKIDTVIRLIKEENWPVEKAMSFANIPEDMRGDVERKIREQLDL